jgi:hypothetical protein
MNNSAPTKNTPLGIMSRHDITNWIIHFVHKRNPENDPLEFSRDWDKTMNYVKFPNNFKYDGEPIYQTDILEEEAYGLEPDESALEVLKKILHDGIIKCGWSYRNGNPTIYGPKSAACFTEMPLYALIEYSKSRNNENYIEPYGVAFLKTELFEAGARPVIYGLSGVHKEAITGDENFGIGLRTLSSECGIGLNELYRYVYTSIKSHKRIDWTHEREWRWADLDEKFEFAGLPFFAKNNEFSFSKIIVLVKTNDDVEEIIKYIQHLYHSESTNYAREYNLITIANTYILSIEELSKFDKDIETVKLDDLPLNKIPKLSKIKVKPETVEKIKNAIKVATNISYAECERVFNERGDVGSCGWANIVTYVSNSEITQALIDLGLASSYGTGHYDIELGKSFPVQSLDVNESGKIKAAEYLTKELGQYFTTHWTLD